MALNIQVTGLLPLRQRMTQRGRRLKSMRAVNLRAAVLVDQWVQRNFRAEGRMHDDPRLFWPPLKASTIAGRRRGRTTDRGVTIGTGRPKILQDTGRLRSGFEVSANNDYGEVRNRVEYAKQHEDGFGYVPQRKMFPERAQALDIVRPAYQEHVRRAVR